VSPIQKFLISMRIVEIIDIRGLYVYKSKLPEYFD